MSDRGLMLGGGFGSALTTGLGVLYAVVLIGYAVGLVASLLRLHRFPERFPPFSLHTAAAISLAVGWPTGFRAHADVLRGRREVSTLVNSRTRPLLVGFSLLGATFVVIAVPIYPSWSSSSWRDLGMSLVGLAAIVDACITWLVDPAPPP